MLNLRILKLLKIINYYHNIIKSQRKNHKKLIKIQNIENNQKVLKSNIKANN